MVEKTVDPPPAVLRLYFPPWWGRKEEKEPKKAMKGTVMAAFLGCQSFVGGEEVSFGGGYQEGRGKVPGCLLEDLESSHFYQILLMQWERAISQAF